MKKIIIFAIAAIMLMTCAACGSSSTGSHYTDYSRSNSEHSNPEYSNSTVSDEPLAEVELADLCVYTFYNNETHCYLSCEGRNLILSKASHQWVLRQVDEDTFNICDMDTELILDIENAHVAVGTAVKIWEKTGYDVQVWSISRNKNGTYSILYSGNNQYCLGFDNGNAVLQIRDESNAMQEWTVVNVSESMPKDYMVFKSKNNIIELQLPLNILEVISETRLQQWANDLETAYYSFNELTDFTPYKRIVVEAYKPSDYPGWVIDNSNIIHIDKDFIYDDLKKMAARDSDWNFCALHEMGHMFDSARPWTFEAELMTDLKLVYVLEKNNATAAPSEFDASYSFSAENIIDAYYALGSDFSSKYNIYGCTARFLEIKDDIGWDPFVQTFHYMQANESSYSNYSKLMKFEKFVELLSSYSNTDIKSYFSSNEWNVIVQQCGS